jgi:GrpB-like predicted nucleotidyltransferase (UPF0157 family)
LIYIVPYKPIWQEEFRQIGGLLRKYLGDMAIRIDHIGSTAVPGLAAKDIIDIQVTAAELTDKLERALGLAGYQRILSITHDHVPPGGDADPRQWEKWIFKPEPGGRRVNVHVRLPGRQNQRYALLFRDYLRAFPGVALAYGQVKMALAQYHPEDDMEAYYDIKDPACDIIFGGAEFWAGATRWQPGASDC